MVIGWHWFLPQQVPVWACALSRPWALVTHLVPQNPEEAQLPGTLTHPGSQDFRSLVTGGSRETKSRDWRKGHPETAPPGDPSHIQTPNPETIADAKKCLLKGACNTCLLRDSARAWQIQRWILTANHCTEHSVPNGGVRLRTEGAERVCNSIGRTTI